MQIIQQEKLHEALEKINQTSIDSNLPISWLFEASQSQSNFFLKGQYYYGLTYKPINLLNADNADDSPAVFHVDSHEDMSMQLSDYMKSNKNASSIEICFSNFISAEKNLKACQQLAELSEIQIEKFTDNATIPGGTIETKSALVKFKDPASIYGILHGFSSKINSDVFNAAANVLKDFSGSLKIENKEGITLFFNNEADERDKAKLTSLKTLLGVNENAENISACVKLTSLQCKMLPKLLPLQLALDRFERIGVKHENEQVRDSAVGLCDELLSNVNKDPKSIQTAVHVLNTTSDLIETPNTENTHRFNTLTIQLGSSHVWAGTVAKMLVLASAVICFAGVSMIVLGAAEVIGAGVAGAAFTMGLIGLYRTKQKNTFNNSIADEMQRFHANAVPHLKA